MPLGRLKEKYMTLESIAHAEPIGDTPITLPYETAA